MHAAMIREPGARHPAAVYATAPRTAQLAPRNSELFALLGLCAVALILYNAGAYGLLNILGPVWLGVVLGVADWDLARRYPSALFTPLFSFRLAAFVFLALGSLVPEIVSAASQDLIFQLYAYSPQEAAKTNLIFILGTSTLLTSVRITAAFSRPVASVQPRAAISDLASNRSTLFYGLAFFVAGISYSLLYELPKLLGIFTFLLPGSLISLFQAANGVGLLLIALWGLERRGIGFALIAATVLITTVIGFITLNKTTVLFPELFLGLAFLLRRVNVTRVMLVTILLVGSLTLLQPMVAQGRLMQITQYGDLDGGTLADRVAYSTDYLSGVRIESVRSESDGGLLRLSYLNAATFIVAQYDVGLPATSVVNAVSAIIPRTLWPDKPFISDVGSDLFFMLTGQEGSALGTTVFADLYWNLGWPGVILLSIVIGIVCWPATTLSYRIMATRDWIMMPFVLLAFRIGLSLDNAFVVSVFAPAVMSLAAYFLLRGVALAFSGRQPVTTVAGAPNPVTSRGF